MTEKRSCLSSLFENGRQVNLDKFYLVSKVNHTNQINVWLAIFWFCRSEWYLDNSDNLMRWSSIPNPLWYSIISYSYKNEEYHIRSSHIYGLLVSFQFVNTITNIGKRGQLIVKCFLINLFIDQLWYCVLIEFEAF